VFEGMCKKLGIVHTKTPVYNPQSNSVERFHSTLGGMLRVDMPRMDVEWDRRLPFICLAYNSKVNASTGLTPALAFLGREMTLPAEMPLQVPDKDYPSPHDGAEQMMKRYTAIYSFMSKKQEAVIRRNAQSYIGSAKFEPDDLVWYLTSRRLPGIPSKLTNHWLGPWKVMAKVAEVLYRIRPADPSSKHKPMVVHVGRLSTFYGKPTDGKIPENIVLSGEDTDDMAEELALFPTTRERVDVPVQVPLAVPEIQDWVAAPPRQPDLAEEVLPPPPPPLEVDDQMVDEVSEPMPDLPNVPSTSGAGVDVGGSRRASLKRRGPELEGEQVNPPQAKRGGGFAEKFKQQFQAYQQAVEPHEAALPDSDAEMQTLASLTVPMRKGAKVPHRGTPQSAGYDLYLPVATKLPPGKVTAVPLGLSLKLPDRHYLSLHGRSSLERSGIFLAGGIIDSDFTGQITVLLFNSTQKLVCLHKHQRIAQGILLRYELANFVEVDRLPTTSRGTGGFGHTGTGVPI
jgi:dUTP pyrophosphatase